MRRVNYQQLKNNYLLAIENSTENIEYLISKGAEVECTKGKFLYLDFDKASNSKPVIKSQDIDYGLSELIKEQNENTTNKRTKRHYPIR